MNNTTFTKEELVNTNFDIHNGTVYLSNTYQQLGGYNHLKYRTAMFSLPIEEFKALMQMVQKEIELVEKG